MVEFLNAVAQLEATILTAPSNMGVEGYNPLMDDLIDLLWEEGPQARARFTYAVQEFHEAYAGR